MVFAVGYGKPSILLVDIDTGDLAPVPSPLDDDSAFDMALPRHGWVAVQIGSGVAAYRDGALLDPLVLPPAWQIFPAIEPDAILIRLHPGPGHERGEPSQVVVVDGSGNVRRSGTFPPDAGHGEVTGGVLGLTGIWSWSDQSFTPLDGRPIGVLGGHVVLLARPGEVEALDLRTGASRRCTVPQGHHHFLGARYDPTASRFAAGEQRGVLVASLDDGPRWIRLGAGMRCYGPVWLADGTLLLDSATVLDVRTGETIPLASPVRRGIPRADVTGRFDLGQAKAACRQPAEQPMTPDQRTRTLAEASQLLAASAPLSVAPYLARARAGVRLRSLLPAGDLPLGASHIGGQPDMPGDHQWPLRDGVPMAFLTQVRLDQVAAAAASMPMQPTGLLSIFVALEANGMYLEDDDCVHAEIFPMEGLSRAPWPAALAEDLRFEVAELAAEPLLTLPDVILELGENGEEAWDALVQLITPPGPDHRMFGHPAFVQSFGDPWPADKRGEPMVPLLQIDSDSIGGFGFGDGGRLHFWVPANHLAKADLSACIIEMDCS
jgi:uncharacterized protein YwqG